MKTSLAIIGAGRVGQTIGRLAHLSGQYQISTVYCRRIEQANEASHFIGAGKPCAKLEQPLHSDLYLLSVPDDAILSCATALKNLIPLKGLVFHASGALDIEVLQVLATEKGAVGSLHPAFSFATPAISVAHFPGTHCAIEGNDWVYKELSALTYALGAHPFRIQAAQKAAYHGALSIASNFLVTLNQFALSILRQADIEPALADELVTELMQQTLANIKRLGPLASLSGPIRRADTSTLKRHMALFNEDERALYRALGRATLQLARPHLLPEQYYATLALLS